MRAHSHINTIKGIINSYDGSIPLASWIKQFFKANKKYGASDRRDISHACFCFYRMGNVLSGGEPEERILVGLLLCSPVHNRILAELRPQWNEFVRSSLDEKLDRLQLRGELSNLFPFEKELSPEIETVAFHRSLLIQPDLFLRARPNKADVVMNQLGKASITCNWLGEDCLQLSNQAKLDDVIRMDQDAVVQDLNSQRVLELLCTTSKLQQAETGLSVWDCCAASGGKAILFHDRVPGSRLTVSDIRESILVNLRNRFRRAGIKEYHSFVADLSSERFLTRQKFDVVICDAPCSGSGTWSRTPEQMHFFDVPKIGHYADLQKRIVLNASRSVASGGYLLYITCSVFRKENEEVIENVCRQTPLQLVGSKYLKGYHQRADTLFTALLSM